MRKSIIAANWKMNKTQKETVEFLEALNVNPLPQDKEIWIAPPFTALAAATAALLRLKSSLVIGAQNVNEHIEGPFTGEISPRMILDVGANFVIIGHSERRQYYGETGSLIRKKIEQVVKVGLIPLLCIGETETERSLGQTSVVLKKQIEDALSGFSRDLVTNLVIAYEPIWAIGTGKVATSEMADETHHDIRKILADLLSLDFARAVRILYGGSVKPEFMTDLMSKRDIDGVLVGGASLDPGSFLKIINY